MQTDKLSDAEVVCGFMEPRPTDRSGPTMRTVKWWVLEGMGMRDDAPWVPTSLTLDRLHEVEARLNGGQRYRYAEELWSLVQTEDSGTYFKMIHASAADKLKALAEVLRG